MISSIMAVSVQIKVNSNLYLRDPQDTKLGKKIIKEGPLQYLSDLCREIDNGPLFCENIFKVNYWTILSNNVG